jgi:hypothetical protein
MSLYTEIYDILADVPDPRPRVEKIIDLVGRGEDLTTPVIVQTRSIQFKQYEEIDGIELVQAIPKLVAGFANPVIKVDIHVVPGDRNEGDHKHVVLTCTEKGLT